MDHSKRLGTAPLKKLLFQLSMPATIGMFMNALYNVVDTIFVGQGVGKLGIGALSIVFPIQLINFAFAIAIAQGTASGISRNLGAKDYKKATSYFQTSYVMTLTFSIIVAILGYHFSEPMLRFFGSTDDILPYAMMYAQIIFIGFIPNGFAVLSNTIIRAEGSALYAMVAMSTGVIINIFLDPLLIFTFDMGVQGAAIATIASQFISASIGIGYFYFKKSAIPARPHQISFSLPIALDTFVVGLPSFIRNAIGSISIMIINNSLGFYGGEVAIGTYGIINKLMSFTMMPSFGIVQGMQPIAGFNYGARQFDRVRDVLRLSLRWATIILTLSGVIIFTFPDFFILLFTDVPEIVELGRSAIRFIFFVTPFLGLQTITATLYQSLGMAKPAFFLSILRQLLLLVPFVLILPNFFGLNGIFLSFPVSDTLACIISTVLFLRIYRQLKEDHAYESK